MGKLDQLCHALRISDPVPLVSQCLHDHVQPSQPAPETLVGPDVATSLLRAHLRDDPVWVHLAAWRAAADVYGTYTAAVVEDFLTQARVQTGLEFVAESSYRPGTEAVRSPMIFWPLKMALEHWMGRPPEVWTSQIVPLTADADATYLWRLAPAGGTWGPSGRAPRYGRPPGLRTASMTRHCYRHRSSTFIPSSATCTDSRNRWWRHSRPSRWKPCWPPSARPAGCCGRLSRETGESRDPTRAREDAPPGDGAHAAAEDGDRPHTHSNGASRRYRRPVTC